MVRASVAIEVILPREATRAQIANVSMSLLLMNRHVALHVSLLGKLLQADRTWVSRPTDQVLTTRDALTGLQVTAARTAADQRQVVKRVVMHLQRKTVHNSVSGTQAASRSSKRPALSSCKDGSRSHCLRSAVCLLGCRREPTLTLHSLAPGAGTRDRVAIEADQSDWRRHAFAQVLHVSHHGRCICKQSRASASMAMCREQ